MNANESHKTRWSLTAFVLLAALIFSVFAYRSFGSALILMSVVVLIVIVVHAVMRLAARRKSA